MAGRLAVTALLLLARAALALVPTFNILDYGAVADNATLNTAAIQRAIGAAAAVGAEAHVLVPPPGVFKTGALALASNVYLLLPTGATLHGAATLAAYTDAAGEDWDRWDVLHTRGAVNTGVLGDAGGGGTLAGPMWQMISHYDAANNQLSPVTWAGQHGCRGECRPRLLVFEDCANVTVANVRLVDSADWTQLYRRTSGVLLANLTVWGSQQWPNNDGVDFESCAGVVVRNSTFFTGDDGIVLASGNCNDMRVPWPEPFGAYSPTRDVLIEDVTLSSNSAALKWEAIFQAWHGDVLNVTVRNALIHDSNRGIGFQQRTGGGAFRDVLLEGVRVLRTRGIVGEDWWGAGEALWVTSLPEAPGYNYSLGGVHNVVLRDCELEGEQGGIVIAQGATGAGAVAGLVLQNTTLRVGVFGNATRRGLHDLRPLAQGAQQLLAHNVTGWFWGGVAGAPGQGARVQGGAVEFEGPPQAWWARGTCSDSEGSPGVQVAGLACAPCASASASASAAAASASASASASAAASAAASWTLLPNTRCHGDTAQLPNVSSLAACEAACFSAPGFAPLVTYCGAGEAACGGLSGHCWCYPSAALRAGCTAQGGWQSAWTAAAPPPPPPPAPLPADWAAAVLAGDMLFWGGALPPAGHLPGLGNGNLAKEVGPYHTSGTGCDAGSFYLAGVFNGVGNVTASHRAAIPDAADVQLLAGEPLGAALDLRGGAYLNRTLVRQDGCMGAQVQQRLYAHRAEKSLFVVELRASAPPGGSWPAAGCSLALAWAVGSASPDFNVTSFQPGAPGGAAVLSLTALAAETPGAPPRRVAMAYPAWLAAAGGAPSATFAASGDVLLAAIVLRSDLDAPDPAAAAARDWQRLTALGADALLASHTAAWGALWDSGGIELQGNLTVAAAANSSLFAILSALRADVNFSTCPGGLSTNSYNGHTFWDMETWIYPNLLLLYPDLAAGALQYRLDRLGAAIARSGEYGFVGANWPWESAFSGVDTTRAPNIEGQFEHHISGDIAMAMRQYYLATLDVDFLKRAWPALNATCAFWACRFARVDAAHGPGCGSKAGAGNFTIRSAQGPDENAGVVDDSAYTVGVGAATLAFCGVAARALGLPPPPQLWADIASAPYLPTSDNLYSGGPVHPEFTGYAGAHINQADVALLQYPLGVEFERKLALRDLDYYSALTGVAAGKGEGAGGAICPFFTGNSAYGIAYLALGNRTAADVQFELGYLHQTPEFHVWTEYTPAANYGHLNFITGAGGWLQALLYGYPGLRLAPAGGALRFATPAPSLPPGGITAVRLRGLHLLGTAFDFAYDSARVCVALRGARAGAALQLRSEATGATVPVAAAEACLPLAEVIVEAAAA